MGVEMVKMISLSRGHSKCRPLVIESLAMLHRVRGNEKHTFLTGCILSIVIRFYVNMLVTFAITEIWLRFQYERYSDRNRESIQD